MRICCVSDLHGHLPPDVPPCDLLLVAGDVGPESPANAEIWLSDVFAPWLQRQPATAKVGIAGNRDFLAEQRPESFAALPWHYLTDELIVGQNDIPTIFGSPWSPTFGEWAFQRPDWQLAGIWAAIPGDTEIVLTHTPPVGYVDTTVDGIKAGSASLLARLLELESLRLVVCGHIHEAAGMARLPTGVPVVNASVLNERFELVRGAYAIEP